MCWALCVVRFGGNRTALSQRLASHLRLTPQPAGTTQPQLHVDQITRPCCQPNALTLLALRPDIIGTSFWHGRTSGPSQRTGGAAGTSWNVLALLAHPSAPPRLGAELGMSHRRPHGARH